MSLLWAIAIMLASAVIAVAALLLVRRYAPEGGHYSDGDRTAGFFGVLATGFSVLLGFVIFLAFTSYDNSRSGAETEAFIVAQQFETAQYLSPRIRPQLENELVCYARYVVYQSWPRLEQGTFGNSINPWSVAMPRTLRSVQPRTPSENAAFAKWIDQDSDRDAARNDRIHAAQGVVPVPLWIVLFLTAAVIVVFLAIFADSGEPVVVQAVQAGSVVLVLTASLLLLWFLDNPYHPGIGELRPDAMKRTLAIIGERMHQVAPTGAPPCTSRGLPLSSS